MLHKCDEVLKSSLLCVANASYILSSWRSEDFFCLYKMWFLYNLDVYHCADDGCSWGAWSCCCSVDRAGCTLELTEPGKNMLRRTHYDITWCYYVLSWTLSKETYSMKRGVKWFWIWLRCVLWCRVDTARLFLRARAIRCLWWISCCDMVLRLNYRAL